MRALSAVGLLLSLTACDCGPGVTKVNPSLSVSPVGLDFGQVKVGDLSDRVVRMEAQTRASVLFTSIRVEGPGAAAFQLGPTPTELEPLGAGAVSVRFTPTAVAAFTASLVIESNDPERPVVRMALAGEGALPKLELTLDCQQARGCTAAVVADPPSIDFGLEPLVRLMPIDPTRLPTLVIVNAGAVPLDVSGVALTGADAAAFSLAGNAGFPDGGVSLLPAAGFNLPLRFVPTSEQQASYAAQVQIRSDDPDRPTLTVELTGALRPNQPPQVCANLIRVTPTALGDAPRDYSSAAEWSALLVPPAGGYDFSATRDVRPGELAIFSAISDSADPTRCSTDPEDGRMGLTYRWRWASTPPGAENLAIAGATTGQAQLRPVITGAYTLELTVTDSRGSATTTTLRFAVAIKQDLVAQLQWPGFAGVDLDVHLVRPSSVDGGDPFTGAFSFFQEGDAGRTSGDINGYARRVQSTNPGAGLEFDWGLPGVADDPVLNVDDRGTGDLLENVSLNYPENDARCATTDCTYRVLVHYFNDGRQHPSAPACVVDGGVGCQDGEACACAAPTRCVAEAAPVGAPPLGSGKCYPAPTPVVRLFFRGSPTPAAVVPLENLMPADEVALGAPCKLWHVADVSWPARSLTGSLPDGGTPPPVVTVIGADGTGRIVSPVFARFGRRQSGGSLQCAPDLTLSGIDWYGRQP